MAIDSILCPKCGGKMTMLFISAVCDVCDPPKAPSIQPTLPSLAGKHVVVSKPVINGPMPAAVQFQNPFPFFSHRTAISIARILDPMMMRIGEPDVLRTLSTGNHAYLGGWYCERTKTFIAFRNVLTPRHNGIAWLRDDGRWSSDVDFDPNLSDQDMLDQNRVTEIERFFEGWFQIENPFTGLYVNVHQWAADTEAKLMKLK